MGDFPRDFYQDDITMTTIAPAGITVYVCVCVDDWVVWGVVLTIITPILTLCTGVKKCPIPHLFKARESLLGVFWKLKVLSHMNNYMY